MATEQQDLLIELPGESWNEVPEKQPPIPASIYSAVIEKFSVDDNAKKTGKNLIFRLKVVTADGKARGFNYYVGFAPELDKHKIKALMLRAGVPVPADKAPFNIKSLLGTTIQVAIGTEPFTDPATGITEERNTLPNLAKV